MRLPALLLPLLLTASVLAGCGAPPSSAEDFEGEARAVAETVEDIQRAAERQETDRICRDFLTDALGQSVAAGGQTCQEQLEKSVEDVDVFELEVEDVEVNGTTATATVRGESEPEDSVRRFRLEKTGQPARWRVDSFGEGA